MQQPKWVEYKVLCTDGTISRKGLDFYPVKGIVTSTNEDYENNLYDKCNEFINLFEDNTLLNKEILSDNERKTLQNSVNPKYVLRNYMAQMAIELAEKEDYSLLNELYKLLLNPYEEQPEFEKWFDKRPDWARQKIGSSMLSCSS
mgnify:CR=1 FL=1